VDRGAIKELVVKGMSRNDLVLHFERAAIQKGFTISNKQHFHNSTLVTAEKGSVAASVGVDIITEGLSRFTESGNAYTAQADISERGGMLKFCFLVTPRGVIYERDSYMRISNYPILDLIMDPISNGLLEDILNLMRSQGVVLEDMKNYQDLVGLKPGEKVTDDFGWTIERSETVQIGTTEPPDYKFGSCICGIIGFLGTIMLVVPVIVSGFRFQEIPCGFYVIGALLSMIGCVGFVLSLASIFISKKHKRKQGIAFLIMSIPSFLTVVGLVVLFFGVFIYFLGTMNASG
jgi:hypothetical protein